MVSYVIGSVIAVIMFLTIIYVEGYIATGKHNILNIFMENDIFLLLGLVFSALVSWFGIMFYAVVLGYLTVNAYFKK